MSLLGIWAGLRTIWAWRFPIAILLAVMAAGGIWLRLGHLNAQLDKARAERAQLIETNQATMEALDALASEKARNESLLADRAARKSKEADQLSAIIKRINDRDKALDCPVSPAIDDALDGSL